MIGMAAMTTMLRNNIGRLPVVGRDDPTRLVGYLGRAKILVARLRRMDELIEWAGTQPATLATRRALISRYADAMFAGELPAVMRFFEQNQTVLKSLAAGQQMRDRMMRLAYELCRGDDSPAAQLRAALTLFAVHSSWFAVRTPGITDDERKKIALEVADELLARIADAS